MTVHFAVGVRWVRLGRRGFIEGLWSCFFWRMVWSRVGGGGDYSAESVSWLMLTT